MSEAPLPNSSRKVMVIGLDGATWDLIRPWIAQDRLPNLAEQVRRGAAADMKAELPPSSVPNWPAFMTGKNAGKHACFWWLQRDRAGYPDRLPIDARNVRGETLWSCISALGKRVIVQNVPVTYPLEPVNGVMISGLLTPHSAQDFIYPASLKPALDEATGGYQIYPSAVFARGQEEKFIAGQIAHIHQHLAAAEHLLDTQPWDFFMLVIGPTDEAAHKLWHYMDPTHPRYQPQVARQVQDGLLRIYSAADEAVGKLAARLGPQDTLLLMSDHGFGPVDSFFHANNWLMRNGYLKLKRTAISRLRQALYHIGFTPSNVFPLGKQILSYLRGNQGLRQRLDPGRQGSQSPLRRIFLTSDDIDWAHTRAIATGFLYAQIFINLQGRDPQGIVTPEAYEPLRTELIDKLSQVTNPMRRQLHYAHIHRREELYSGPATSSLPDLLCVPRDLRSADSGMDFRSNRLFDRDTALSGTHREQGIFLLSGPGVLPHARLAPVRIFDLAPTIFYCLNLPVPDDLDGSVITEAFEEGQFRKRPVQFAPARPTRPGEQAALSPDEEESIKKRLQELGYLS